MRDRLSTTDTYDDNIFPSLQNGHIQAPIKVALGSPWEGLDLARGGAELNGPRASRVYQKICLGGGEEFNFRYQLGNPDTHASFSQVRIGLFKDDGSFPAIHWITKSPRPSPGR